MAELRHLPARWRFMVRGYCAVSGELALETVHANETSRDLEVAVFNNRQDVGRVEVISRDED